MYSPKENDSVPLESIRIDSVSRSLRMALSYTMACSLLSRVRNVQSNLTLAIYGAELSAISLQLDERVAHNTSYDADADENQPCFFPAERIARRDGRSKRKPCSVPVALGPLPLPNPAYHLAAGLLVH